MAMAMGKCSNKDMEFPNKDMEFHTEVPLSSLVTLAMAMGGKCSNKDTELHTEVPLRLLVARLQLHHMRPAKVHLTRVVSAGCPKVLLFKAQAGAVLMVAPLKVLCLTAKALAATVKVQPRALQMVSRAILFLFSRMFIIAPRSQPSARLQI
jgi:hypothetical protein